MIATANTLILSGWCMPMSQHVQRICRALRGCAIIAPSHASGPVRSNTFSEAVATPTDKRGFATSESQTGAGASGDCHAGFGRGGPTREDGRTTSDVFETPRPPDARSNADGGFVHVPEGIDMTRTTSTKGKTARTQATHKTTPIPALPFVTHTVGPRGGHIRTNFFDAPTTGTWTEGSQFGNRAAAALLAWAAAGCDPHISLHTFIKSVATASGGTESERGAAFAVLEVLSESFKFAAKRGSWDRYFEGKAREDTKWVEIEKKREANRIQRSIEARRAKRAADAKGGADV